MQREKVLFSGIEVTVLDSGAKVPPNMALRGESSWAHMEARKQKIAYLISALRTLRGAFGREDGSYGWT